MELNDVIELKDSIGEVPVTITPEMCCQVMLSVGVVSSFASSRAANTSSICVKSRVYALGRKGHQLAFLLTHYMH